MANHADESLAQTGRLCQDDAMDDSMVGRNLMVSTVDYHTAGEPFRIVSGGVPALRGKTMLEKRRYALEHLDHIRQLLVFEPRGHADMYGGFVTDPQDDGAQVGVVFFQNADLRAVILRIGDEPAVHVGVPSRLRSEEHTSELQSR